MKLIVIGIRPDLEGMISVSVGDLLELVRHKPDIIDIDDELAAELLSTATQLTREDHAELHDQYWGGDCADEVVHEYVPLLDANLVKAFGERFGPFDDVDRYVVIDYNNEAADPLIGEFDRIGIKPVHQRR